MSQPEQRTPVLAGTGDAEVESSVRTPFYFLSATDATDFAAHTIARRHRLTMPTARLICDLASLGRLA